MKQLVLLASLLLLSWTTTAATPEINIVPKPLLVKPAEGSFTVDAKTTVAAGPDKELLRVGRLFATMIEPVTGHNLPVKRSSANAAILLSVNDDLEEEEYRLTVTPHDITVQGGSPKGVLYGLQSLRQLIVDGGGIVPAVEISDKPFFGYRGAMLDVVRHFMPVEDVKAFIDIVAMHKLNRFHWHLTDDQGWRIDIRKYPDLARVGSIRKETLFGHLRTSSEYDGTPYGGYYTQSEIREIVNYAAERYVEVIPEIEMPGHALGALTPYPWLGCRGEGYNVWTRWGISSDVFCAGKETTFEFIENVLAEVIELFPSKYIHIGGDECPKARWKACPHCQQRIKENGLQNEEQLQSYFMQRVEKWLQAHGREIIGWDEILQGGISKTATVMSWRGSKGGIAAAKAGNKAIMAPNTHCYLDYNQTAEPRYEPLANGKYLPVRTVYALDPYDQLTPSERACILGVQANLWTEYIPDFFHAKHMLLPRLAALAEVGWACDRKDFEDFRKRMSHFRKTYDAAGYNYATYFFDGKDE